MCKHCEGGKPLDIDRVATSDELFDVSAIIEGGHCSCYGWAEVTWDGVGYGRDELLKLAKSKIGDSGWYCRCEQRFWKMVIMALEAAL